jgi:hypothetical protein
LGAFLCPEKGGEPVYLKIVCAWCGKLMGIKEAENANFPITHGICCKCKQKALAEAEEALQQYRENKNIIERR